MTITTAKLTRAVRLAWALPLTMSAALLAPYAHAVDLDTVKANLDNVKNSLDGLDYVKPSANAWRIVPMIDMREIFTDNVNLQSRELAHSQLITDVSPGIQFSHNTRRLQVDGQFQLHLYANLHDKLGSRHSSNQLRSAAKAELVDEMVFVDASASIYQQSISPFAQLVSDNDYATANRATLKTWQVSPFMVNRFGRIARSELRYLHDSVDAGNSGLSSSTGDTLSGRLANGPASGDFGWGLSASHQKINNKLRNDSTIKTASLNLSYQVARYLSLTGGLNYDDYDYESIGGNNGGRGHNVGFRWVPSSRTSIDASFGRRYYGPSRNLKALHRSRHTTWNLSYDDAVVTSRGNFLLPGDVDPITGFPVNDPGTNPGTIPRPGSLGGLFDPGVPRPGTVIPPLLPGRGINFFSNRFSLQKQARFSVAMQGARSSAVLNAFKLRREALSARDVDSDLLGTPIDTINDNIEQVGVGTVLTYKLSPRSHVNYLGDITDNTSITTGFKARSSSARLRLVHQFGRATTLTGEVRRVTGLTGLTSGSRYTENAVSVTLNMKL